RHSFHDRRGRPFLSSLAISAKTGSISGSDPTGNYSWFAAYAPMDHPKVAMVALVINNETWRIKASNVGEQAMAGFFR
ncbi:MAG TPA: penicillin-binding transpeptidase domain-containing protein, partial [Geobacterales bacterium]|nr:penicillin-binding transpeptidase domain-containing protein [Geobacterales bacterium]